MKQISITVKPGNYVVAVSGGVDSMLLLNILADMPGMLLTVAHYDHGIRSDSTKDRQLVAAAADILGLPFKFAEGHLGAGASEATARKARYEFLRQVLKDCNAQAIITAHHQDDVLETAILNMLRGTGRSGLNMLSNSPDLLRPLVTVPKLAIIEQAMALGIAWREDSTNSSTKYRRNYVRQQIVPRLRADGRQQLLALVSNGQRFNQTLDSALEDLLGETKNNLNRLQFLQLPHAVAMEVTAFWLRQHQLRQFDSATLERIVVQAKTLPPGQKIDVISCWSITVGRETLALSKLER